MSNLENLDWVLVGKTQDLISELEASGNIKELTVNERKIGSQ